MTNDATQTKSKPGKQSPEGMLTDADLAAMFQVATRTLRLWRHTRGLPFIRITPKVIRYREDDVINWADRQRTVIAA